MSYEIQRAKIIRSSHREGLPFAEVEVDLKGFDKPFTVKMEKKQGQYSLSQVLQNDQDHAIDWYDNDLHQAYFNMKNHLFQSHDHSNSDNPNTNNEKVFLNQLLEFEEIKDELNRL